MFSINSPHSSLPLLPSLVAYQPDETRMSDLLPLMLMFDHVPLYICSSLHEFSFLSTYYQTCEYRATSLAILALVYDWMALESRSRGLGMGSRLSSATRGLQIKFKVAWVI